MQIREITVTYGGKLNLGDYNSAHVEISITGVLNDGEDAADATAALFTQAKVAVRDQAAYARTGSAYACLDCYDPHGVAAFFQRTADEMRDRVEMLKSEREKSSPMRAAELTHLIDYWTRQLERQQARHEAISVRTAGL